MSRSSPQQQASVRGVWGAQRPPVQRKPRPAVSLPSVEAAPSTSHGQRPPRRRSPRRGRRPRGSARAAEAPTPEMLQVLEPQPEGPRITPFLAYQLERAWALDAARQERFARVKTEADLRDLQDELRQKVLARHRRAAGREDAAQRPRHRHDPDGRLPDREARLREPARAPRDRARLRARRPGREEAGGARGLRPLAGRQGLPRLPGDRRPPRAPRLRRPLLGPGRPGRAQPVLGQGARAQPLQPRLRRARGPRQLRDDRRDEPRALHGVGRDARRRLPAHAGRRGRRAASRSRARAAAASSPPGSAPSTRASPPSCRPASRPRCPCGWPTASSRTPTATPSRTRRASSPRGSTTPGLLLLAYPRPAPRLRGGARLLPDRGDAQDAARGRGASTGASGTATASRSARATTSTSTRPRTRRRPSRSSTASFGRPAHAGLGEAKTLAPEALRCTPTGQVREDLGGRSLLEVIRDDARARPPGARDARRALPRRRAIRASATGRSWRSRASRPRDAIAWEAGRQRPRRRRDRRALPSAPQRRARRSRWCTCAGTAARAATLLLRLGLEGKIGPADWPEVEARLAEGHEVVSFDPRGLGETRMRYKAASIDDPALAPADEEAAYASPLSGVLANHVYNAQLARAGRTSSR